MCKTTNGGARAIRLCCVVLPAEQRVDALVQYRYRGVVLLLFLLHHRSARAEVLDRVVKFGTQGGELAFLPIRLRRTHTYFSSKRKAQHHVCLGFLLRPASLFVVGVLGNLPYPCSQKRGEAGFVLELVFSREGGIDDAKLSSGANPQ